MDAATTTLRRPRPAPLTVTDNGARRIAEILAQAPADAVGVRLSTPRRGCSGLAYDLAYVTAAKPGDERIETPGGVLFVDGGSLMYLIGSVMAQQEKELSQALKHTDRNPNFVWDCEWFFDKDLYKKNLQNLYNVLNLTDFNEEWTEQLRKIYLEVWEFNRPYILTPIYNLQSQL